MNAIYSIVVLRLIKITNKLPIIYNLILIFWKNDVDVFFIFLAKYKINCNFDLEKNQNQTKLQFVFGHENAKNINVIFTKSIDKFYKQK